MKNPPLKYLVYSEFAAVKKALLVNMSACLLMAVAVLVFQLSVSYGNLGKFSEMFGFLSVTLVWLCTICPFMIVADNKNDINDSWIRFRMSTPASPLRLAAAKYIVILGGMCVGGVVAILLLTLLKLFGNTDVTAQNIKIGLMLGVFMLIVATVMRVALLVFRSEDKAGIALIVFMVPIVALLGRVLSKNKEQLGEYFPIVTAAGILIFIGGFAATVVLYNRREN